MNPARFLATWLLFLAFVGVGRPAEAPAGPRPNLVLVVADDVQTDPHEIHNLAADPTHQSVLRELQARLRRFQAETKDPWIVKYEHE
jgi:hypothetical protein